MNKPILDINLKNQLVLTPQLQQAIKILNMNQLELSQEINRMLEDNFMFELDSQYNIERQENDKNNDKNNDDKDFEDDANSTIDELGAELEHDAEWDDYYDNDWQEYKAKSNENANIEQYLCCQQQLCEYVVEQLAQMPIASDEKYAATIIAYCLDEEGYFRDDINSIAKNYNISVELLRIGIKHVQNCQPSGIAAHNLEECLKLQIAALPSDTLHLKTLQKIMHRYFCYIGKDSQLICQRLKLDAMQYEHAIRLLRSLNPQPGLSFMNNYTEYVKPEIYVRESNGISYIESNNHTLPKLSINEDYVKMVKEVKGEEKTLLNAKLQQARWFVAALDKRMETIHRVATVIVAIQQDFFQHGESAMKPLTRSEVATILDIHESTVSRALNGKYLMCKRGLYELRYFFSNTMENVQGEDLSIIAIKAKIGELIDGEDARKPLSDQKICDLLAEEGQIIARRTVAKYRESLNIATSSQRRKK